MKEREVVANPMAIFYTRDKAVQAVLEDIPAMKSLEGRLVRVYDVYVTPKA